MKQSVELKSFVLLATTLSCLALASGARPMLTGRSLSAEAPAGEAVCPNSQFGVDYPGNDLKSIDNVFSPGECCYICGSTPGCVAYTWVAVDGTKIALPLDPQEANGGAVPNRCYLKNAFGAPANSDFTVSGQLQGSQTCPNLLTGMDLPGNDIKSIDNVPSPAACCATCSATQGCKSFTYVTATDPNNAAAAVAQRCYLKSGAGTNPTPYAQCTSGVLQPANATSAPDYYPPMQVLFHSQDDMDSMSTPVEAYFLPQGQYSGTTSPGFYAPNAESVSVLLVFLLSQPSYSIKQVDWYLHKKTTSFTDPTNPPVPSSKSITSAPYYLGTTAHGDNGQGLTYDLQNLRLSNADTCGSPSATFGGTYCTATIVVTLEDGSKIFGARNTFRAEVIHSEG